MKQAYRNTGYVAMRETTDTNIHKPMIKKWKIKKLTKFSFIMIKLTAIPLNLFQSWIPQSVDDITNIFFGGKVGSF